LRRARGVTANDILGRTRGVTANDILGRTRGITANDILEMFLIRRADIMQLSNNT